MREFFAYARENIARALLIWSPYIVGIALLLLHKHGGITIVKPGSFVALLVIAAMIIGPVILVRWFAPREERLILWLFGLVIMSGLDMLLRLLSPA